MKIQIVLLACLVALVIGEPASTCPDRQSTSFIMDTEDCSIFYQCYGGKMTKFSCPESTYWNQYQIRCEFDVDCGDRKIITKQ